MTGSVRDGRTKSNENFLRLKMARVSGSRTVLQRSLRVCARILIIVVIASRRKMAVSLMVVLPRFQQSFLNEFDCLGVLARDVASCLVELASRADEVLGWDPV